MSTPLFSVIVPTIGRPTLLAQAVDSVLRQPVSDLECLVIVDGEDRDVIGELPDDRRIRTIPRSRRGGAAAARNTGLEHARGKFVTFLDDDDRYTPARLEAGLEGLERAPIAVCWRDPDPSAPEGSPWRRRLEGSVEDVVLAGPVPHVGQTAIDRRAVPRFDERFAVSEDVEWWMRVAAVGRVATVPIVGYLLRAHAGPRQTSHIEARIRCRFMLLDEHREYFSRNRAAAAYQWKRLGGLAAQARDRSLAREAFSRSFRARPSLSAATHWLRSASGSIRPSASSVRGVAR